MTPTQAENLRILIRHMETKCNRTLEMDYLSVCGTPACAMGEVPAAFPADFALGDHNRKLVFRGEEICIGGISADLFGLGGTFLGPSDLHYRLFGARSCNAWQRSRVTPHEWADEARKVLAEHGYSMDDGFAAFRAKIMKPLDVSVTTEHGTALFPK